MVAGQRERPLRFMTTSSEPVERLYSSRDFGEDRYLDRPGFPGAWPYTRRPRDWILGQGSGLCA